MIYDVFRAGKDVSGKEEIARGGFERILIYRDQIRTQDAVFGAMCRGSAGFLG